MRLILFIAGVFILGNLIVYLVPKSTLQSNQRFAQKAEVASDKINIVMQRLEVEPIKQRVIEPTQKNRTNDAGAPANSVVKNKKCYRVGPFLHASRLTLAKTRLNNLGMLYDVEKRPSNTAEVFRVYLGPYVTSANASAVRQKLSEKGIFDHFQRKEQAGQHIVSLGIYSRSVSAQSSLERFIEMDIDARMRPERTVLPNSFWLNISSAVEEFSPESLRKINWGEHSAQFGAYKC